jgi:hypothetical protein
MFVAITLVFLNNAHFSAITLLFLQKYYANKQDNNDY